MIDQPNKTPPAGMAGLYLVSTSELARQGLPGRVDNRPIRAWAPHPEDDELVYVTTEHPETLAFLPDPYIELD